MNMFNRFNLHSITSLTNQQIRTDSQIRSDQDRHRGLHRQPDQIKMSIAEIHQIRLRIFAEQKKFGEIEDI
jgi:hypothetical protein